MPEASGPIDRDTGVVTQGGPLAVSLVAVAGSPGPWLAEELGRQAVQVCAAGPDAAIQPIALVWLPAGMSEAALREVIRSLRAQGAVRLLGCAPGGTAVDCERGLAAGLDDVVAGRDSSRELASRLQALGRRMSMQRSDDGTRMRFGQVEIDLRQHHVWIAGQAIPMTRTEILVMAALVGARGRCRSRADLLDAAWGDGGLERGERTVDNTISRLRRKLDDPGLIVTVRGVGFRLRGER